MQYLDYLSVGFMIASLYFLLCFILAWVGTRLWCMPKRKIWEKLPEDYDLKSETVYFHSQEIPISGQLIPVKSKDQTRPTIILAHGWSHNGSRMLPLARALNGAGFSVLLYDARGHGISGSDGPITIRKIAQDIIAAVDYLGSITDVDVEFLGLFGHSIGGSASILAASMEPRIKAVISSSGFSDPWKLTRKTLQKMHVSFFPLDWFIFYFLKRYVGRSVETVSPEIAIQKVNIPTMLIHGASDSYIPSSNLDKLYDYSNFEQTKRLLLPGKHHSDLLEDNYFMDEIVNFFNLSLKSNSTTHIPKRIKNISELDRINITSGKQFLH